jgi:hypothetical protein
MISVLIEPICELCLQDFILHLDKSSLLERRMQKRQNEGGLFSPKKSGARMPKQLPNFQIRHASRG